MRYQGVPKQKRDFQTEYQGAYQEYMASKLEVDRIRRKRIWIWLLCIVGGIFLFKITIHEISLPVSLYTNGYVLMVNDQELAFETIQERRIPIVPFLVQAQSQKNTVVPSKEYSEMLNYISATDHYAFQFTEFSCYDLKNSSKVDCDYRSVYEQKIQTGNYRMTILYEKKGAKATEIYRGDVLDDLSSYLKKEGDYHFILERKKLNYHRKIETRLRIGE